MFSLGQGPKKDTIFFQGRRQFYSYIPTESPSLRFFPVRGMKLDVSFIVTNSVCILFFFQVDKSKVNQLFLTSVTSAGKRN